MVAHDPFTRRAFVSALHVSLRRGQQALCRTQDLAEQQCTHHRLAGCQRQLAAYQQAGYDVDRL